MATGRIGIDVTSALSQGGGIGRYTRELVRALVAQDSQYQFRLFSAKISSPYPVTEPLPAATNRVTHHMAPLSERWLYRIWYRARLPLPVQWVTGQLDLFHSPDFVLPPVSDGIPTLLTIHDLSFIHYPDVFPPPLIVYLNRVVPWSVKRASHLLADSKATKEDLCAIWHVPAEKVTVLYSGVSDFFRPVVDEQVLTSMRQKYSLGKPYILAVGTVQPRKNYQMLIRAFRVVAEQLPMQLVIAGGQGWMEEEMLAEVRRQKLEERVSFIGFVDDNDLPAVYSAAALLAFPSIYEGFGLPILEAMACGTPALISNASCLPEVGGAAAVQLSPFDEPGWSRAMISLLGDKQKLAEMSAAGIMQAQRFSWDKAAKQLLEIYHRLTNRQ